MEARGAKRSRYRPKYRDYRGLKWRWGNIGEIQGYNMAVKRYRAIWGYRDLGRAMGRDIGDWGRI